MLVALAMWRGDDDDAALVMAAMPCIRGATWGERVELVLGGWKVDLGGEDGATIAAVRCI